MIAFRKQFNNKDKEKPAVVSTNEKSTEEFSINMKIEEEHAEQGQSNTEEAEKAGQQWSAELIN